MVFFFNALADFEVRVARALKGTETSPLSHSRMGLSKPQIMGPIQPDTCQWEKTRGT